MKLYRRSYRIERVAFLADGCQAMRLHDPDASPKARGFVASPMEYTIRIGDLLTLDCSVPDVPNRNGVVRYRLNGGPWLSSARSGCRAGGHYDDELIAAGLCKSIERAAKGN